MVTAFKSPAVQNVNNCKCLLDQVVEYHLWDYKQNCKKTNTSTFTVRAEVQMIAGQKWRENEVTEGYIIISEQWLIISVLQSTVCMAFPLSYTASEFFWINAKSTSS